MPTVFTGKYVNLTTVRRDGTPVSTPVWFVADNGYLLVETDANLYKVRRIRRKARVTVAACNATGHLRGASRSQHGRVVLFLRHLAAMTVAMFVEMFTFSIGLGLIAGLAGSSLEAMRTGQPSCSWSGCCRR